MWISKIPHCKAKNQVRRFFEIFLKNLLTNVYRVDIMYISDIHIDNKVHIVSGEHPITVAFIPLATLGKVKI